MLKRQKISKLYELRQEIISGILDEKVKYDLQDYNLEYGYFYEIPYQEYPEDLKIIISEAWEEIKKIDRKISDVRKEYES